MSDEKFIHLIHDEMVTAIQSNIEDDLTSLFGPLPQTKGNLSFDELMTTMSSISPKLAWKQDREACQKEDREKGRGHLVMNPGAEGAELLEGDITEKDGIEYRIWIDENLRGMRNDDGTIRMGFWIDPMPPLDLSMKLLPVTVEPDADDLKWEMSIRTRMLNYPPLHMKPIMGLGVDAVDLGPVPLDMVAAELPRATALQQTSALKRRWAAIGRPISLKAYARQSKWGRAWLERKRGGK